MKRNLIIYSYGNFDSLRAFLHELRHEYGDGATLADVARDPERARRIAEAAETVDAINEKIKRGENYDIYK